MTFLRRFFSSNALTATTSDLLTKVSDQYPKLYAKVNIFNFPFTVSRQDRVVMHRLKDLRVGDIIKLDRVREIGSPDYTIKGRPWIDSKYCHVEACVIEHGRGAKVQSKQPKKRKGHQRNLTIKPLTTTLLIRDIQINPTSESSESNDTCNDKTTC